MNIVPMKKKCLIAENARETRTESGIIIQGADRQGESKTGTVLAIGPDVTLVKVGDKILLEWNKGAVVKVGDAQRVIIDEDNIVAIVEDAESD
jgi:co-chaperonin GroES (HSP10)